MSNQADISIATTSITKLETFEVRYEGFEGLPARKGVDLVRSSEFTCFGHQWALELYPGGGRRSSDGMVAASVRHMSDGNIEVQASVIVKESFTKVAAYVDLANLNYGPRGELEDAWGVQNFADRSALIGALKEGALIIEVQMRQIGRTENSLPFIPENPLGKNILEMFMDEKSADVVFEVGASEQAGSACERRAKVSSTPYYAHRSILLKNAPFLADLCESAGDSTPIPLNGIKPGIFHFVMYYAYGGEVSDEDLEANAKDIIDAADRFGVASLKLEAEAHYVKSTVITMDNVMNDLLYADAKNCALLKETAIDFLMENAEEGIEKLSLEDFPGHLVKDVMTAVARGKKKSSGGGNGDHLRTMSVNDLRRKLDEKGLDVDGSREAMIAALNKKIPEWKN